MSKAARIPSYPTLSDADLRDFVLAHRDGAWEELLRRFRGLIYRCIGKVLGRYESVLSSEDSDEVFAEVCMNLWRDDLRKLRAWDPARGSRLGSWIGLIAINSAYDFLRVTARRPLTDGIDRAEEVACDATDPLEALLQKERSNELTEMLSDFSGRDRRFVDLYFSRGMHPEMVAQVMGISVKTVYSKKNKIQSRLLDMTRTDRLAIAC